MQETVLGKCLRKKSELWPPSINDYALNQDIVAHTSERDRSWAMQDCHLDLPPTSPSGRVHDCYTRTPEDTSKNSGMYRENMDQT